MQGYPTIREAAIAAIAYVMPVSQAEQSEYGGFILRNDDGSYLSTEPQTNHNPYHVETEIPMSYAPRVVASWHTHVMAPDVHWTEYFSPTDLTALEQWDHIYLGAADKQRIFEGTRDNVRPPQYVEFLTVISGGVGPNNPPPKESLGELIWSAVKSS